MAHRLVFVLGGCYSSVAVATCKPCRLERPTTCRDVKQPFEAPGRLDSTPPNREVNPVNSHMVQECTVPDHPCMEMYGISYILQCYTFTPFNLYNHDPNVGSYSIHGWSGTSSRLMSVKTWESPGHWVPKTALVFSLADKLGGETNTSPLQSCMLGGHPTPKLGPLNPERSTSTRNS